MSATPHTPPLPQPATPRPPDRAAPIAVVILSIVTLLVLACAVAGAALWWLHHDRIKSSDDAQVTAASPPAASIVVIARFKQEDAAAIRVGQPALVVPPQGIRVPGRVVAVGMQADQATPEPGNVVQVVQRQPVRIRVDAAPAQRVLFLQGMAVRVQVKTRPEL
jgi:multidrug resistance efflux pump